jgi:hypothetical protein
VPGDFEKYSQLEKVLKRDQPKRDGVSLGWVNGNQRIDANVVEQIEEDVEGKDGKDLVLSANDEHDKQSDFGYQAEEAKCRI